MCLLIMVLSLVSENEPDCCIVVLGYVLEYASIISEKICPRGYNLI